MQKIILFTQGCRLNQAESVSLEADLITAGYVTTKTIKNAEIALINTCTVTHKADSDTCQLVNKLKRENSLIKIGIIGCLAEIEKEKLIQDLGVDWVIGNGEKINLVELLQGKTKPAEKLKPKTNYWASQNLTNAGRTRANLKIQDGCDAFCSYCIVPFTRKRERSRPLDDCLKNGLELKTKGFQEIVLTGINIGQYQDQNCDFADLVEKLAKALYPVRIRISSLEPKAITIKFVEILDQNPNICRHLHLPLQSGSDTILKTMHRPYRAQDFQKLIFYLKDHFPQIGLGTDIMVGFPGETEADFTKTVNLIEKLPLSYLHVFAYSDRQNTKSAKLEPKVGDQIKKSRSLKLRNLNLLKKKEFSQSLLGQKLNVLFESQKSGLWQGYTDNYLKVKTKSNQNIKNKIFQVIIEKIEKDFAWVQLL